MPSHGSSTAALKSPRLDETMRSLRRDRRVDQLRPRRAIPVPLQPGCLRSESVDGSAPNRWTASIGLGGRLRSEYAWAKLHVTPNNRLALRLLTGAAGGRTSEAVRLGSWGGDDRQREFRAWTRDGREPRRGTPLHLQQKGPRPTAAWSGYTPRSSRRAGSRPSPSTSCPASWASAAIRRGIFATTTRTAPTLDSWPDIDGGHRCQQDVVKPVNLSHWLRIRTA